MKSGTAPGSQGLSFRSAADCLGAGALLAVAWKILEPASVMAQCTRQS